MRVLFSHLLAHRSVRQREEIDSVSSMGQEYFAISSLPELPPTSAARGKGSNGEKFVGQIKSVGTNARIGVSETFSTPATLGGGTRVVVALMAAATKGKEILSQCRVRLKISRASLKPGPSCPASWCCKH